MTTVKPSQLLTFYDLLSRLTFERAAALLGVEGRRLIMRGSRYEILIHRDVTLGHKRMQVSFPAPQGVVVQTTLELADDARNRLRYACTTCDGACEHVGAMFSVVLENKTQLGLAAPPPEWEPEGPLTEELLVRHALEGRRQRARQEKMRIETADAKTPWTDDSVTSLVSGKSYRVALRGMKASEAYCSCPDFRSNTLGTCKHAMKVVSLVKRKFTASQLRKPYRRKRIAVHLRYGRDVTLHLSALAEMPEAVRKAVAEHLGRPITNLPALVRTLQKLERLGADYHVVPDAEEFIEQRLHLQRIKALVDTIRADPQQHPLRTALLKVPLLPYQLDGVAFAVGSGRAVLADDMGLGKTIQGVGVAELLAREAGIRKVLVVCPASLKAQWRNEIQRFCDRSVQLISGPAAQRGALYLNESFFTVCDFEQVLRDILSIEKTPWDLIILDEGQRIKNWEAKTSRVIKGLKSRFALVLSGTPLENRLDELYSVVQFIDDRRLGPGFRFFHEHRVVDERGMVLGYKNLDQLRARLTPVLLRRTRESVRLELPERTTEVVRIPPTEEQKRLHDMHMQTVAQIVAKKFPTEMDLLRLRVALLMCRMSANGTYLVNKDRPNWSTKLERLAELFDDLADEAGRKVVLFTEWTTMLDLIEPLLANRNLGFVRLDGSVPQNKRQVLVHKFQTDPTCRFFLTTNAGSTGLNLQAANTVINVDLPWNPAVLEQRIARAHRMGQRQPVQVLILITEQTIEENLLSTLSAKKELALAALDPESEVSAVDLVSGAEELKRRLEVLLGARPEADLDRTELQKQEAALRERQRRERVSAAAGEMLGTVFSFLAERVQNGADRPPPSEETVNAVRSRLDGCVEADPSGRPRLSFTLPDRAAVDTLARTLSQLLVGSESSGTSP